MSASSLAGSMCHTAAAERWLIAAVGPHAKHRGHFAGERHKRQMADRVNAAVEPMEVVLADARLDRAVANPHREQL